ncbi:MAG: HAD family hydrolase, partial [Bacteroidota bacterium]
TVFKELQKHHSIHVYTTSYRSAFRIRLLFLLHGLRVGEIINQKTNKAVLSSLRRSCSKYPPAFDFDLHVDDSKGVQIEGVKHGFKVVHVKPTDTDWTKTVLKEIESFVEETH